MSDYRQGNPYCLQIEFTEGCNLRCSFCGLNGIRGKENNYKMMTAETVESVALQMKALGWNSRLEIALHGEPTMNPDFLKLIAIFRWHLPKAYILLESNGGGIMGPTSTETVQEMFGAGLSTLVLDEYQTIKLVPKIMEKIKQEQGYGFLETGEKLFDGSVTFYDYPSCGNIGNPHQRNTNKRLIWIRPIDLNTSGTHSALSNHAGAGSPRNDRAAGKRCAKPFRELSVRWDGNVAICCNDWRGEYPVGNINGIGLDAIWHSDEMYAARRKLYHGERDFGACDGCDNISVRPGILPDHLGKEELPEPSEADLVLIAETLKKGPLTTPVLRPWEIKA